MAYWTNVLDSGRADRGDVLIGFSESPEHIVQMHKSYDRPIPPAEPPPPPPLQPAPPPGPAPTAPNGIHGTNGGETMDGTPGADLVLGYGGDDIVRGGEGDDHLSGHDGRDNLNGGVGNDILCGGMGADWLTGNQGRDIFLYNDPREAADDLVIDFSRGEDALRFHGMAFVGAAAFSITGVGQIRYFHDASPAVTGGGKYGPDTVVQVDANGDSVVDYGVRVQHAVLGDSDFML